MSEPAECFMQHQIIPDILQTAPIKLLKVTYAGGIRADRGGELTPTQVKDQPTVEWDAKPDQLYTLIFTAPDVPSREAPKYREWHLWLVVNIPGNRIDQGEVLSAYVGSGPSKGSGLHRYVFLVYKQPNKLNCNEPRLPNTSFKNREKFSTEKFAAKYKLGNPVAGNFYQAQYDDYVPTLYKQLSGKK